MLWNDLVWKTIEDGSTDVIFNLCCGKTKSPGNLCADLAAKFVNSRDIIQPDLDIFASTLFNKVLDILQIDSQSKLSREMQFTKFHNISFDHQVISDWNVVAGKFNDSQSKSMLLSFIVTKLLSKTLSWRNSKMFTSDQKLLDLKLTKEEEKTLRYVAGFIPFSLMKLYKHRSSVLAMAVCDLFETWREKEELGFEVHTVLQYTKSWTERIDRGGLFKVNDEFYVFIRRIEMVARNVFNKQLIINYKGEDVREILLEKFDQSVLIDQSWNGLLRNIENKQLCVILKDVILKKWVGIRARSFVNAWIQVAKRKHIEISDKSEPSLRKTLNTKKK